MAGNIKKYLTIFFAAVLFIMCSSCKPEPQPQTPVDPDKPINPDIPDPKPVGDLYDPIPEGFVDELNSADQPVIGSIDVDFDALRAMGHPRLMMNKADFDALKIKVTGERFQNRTLYKLHRVAIETADKWVESTVEIKYQLDAAGKRILDQSRLALESISTCAYAYRMTGQKKYLDRAVKDMTTVCNFSDWNQNRHFLDTGEMALAVAIGYDWLYYSLDYELRRKAHKAMRSYALESFMYHWATSNIGNWNQVCYAGTLAAAVAIYGKENNFSSRLINNCLRDNKATIRGIYEPDGIYPEGYAYWGYGTGFQAVILNILDKAFNSKFGLDQFAGFKKTPSWMLMMTGLANKVYCFGDSTGDLMTPKLAMWWFAREYKDLGLLAYEIPLLNNGEYEDSEDLRLITMAITCAKDIENLDSATASTPNTNIWSGNGDVPLVLIRTDWTNTDSDRYLAIKGGYAAASHGHMDAGSFIYDALGVRWSVDLQREAYAKVENALKAAGGDFWNMSQSSLRWDVYRQANFSHSTLTINGAKHLVNGKATIEQVINTNGEYGATMLMTPVLSDQIKSAKRTFRLVDGKNLIVIDEIEAKSDLDANVEWRMMTPATVSIADGTATLSKNGKSLYMSVSSSVSEIVPELKTWQAKGSQTWDSGNTGYIVAGYSVCIPKGGKAILTTQLNVE